MELLEDRLAPATMPVGPGLTGTTATNVVSLGATGAGNLVAHLVLPSALSNQTAGTVYVQYSNTGTAPLAAPLLTLTATQLNSAGVAVSQALLTLNPSQAAKGTTTASLPPGLSHSVQILASGATPGVLQPGESETVPVYWAGWQQPWNPANPPFQFGLTVTQATDTTPINWAALRSALQPAGISAAAWSVLFAGMTSRFGTTAGSYVQELDADAAYLGTLGETVFDVSQLWSFEVNESLGYGYSILPDLAAATDVSLPAPGLPLVFSRTFANTIVGRSVAGPLGTGWFDNWQSTLTVAPGGVVISGEGGSQRIFTPNGSGGYNAQPGDFGILTAPAGTNPDYLLLDQSGIVTAFRPGGTIDSIRDADGNTIRAGYDGSGRLVTLTQSSGQSLRIAYNGAGLIAGVTDSAGGQTTYAYDPTNHYLVSVTGSDGRTVRYTYDTSTGTATSGALLSVAYPDGTHDLFTYDAQGRLSTTSHDGGAEKNTYTYGPGGQLSVIDADGNTWQYFFDDRALVKTVDPLSNATTYGLDGNLNLVSVTNALGQTTTNTYDANGYLTSSTDPAGNTVAYAYTPGSMEEVSTVTDANGNETSYGYDAQGNLLTITYPDTTTQQFRYDPLGNQIGSIDPNGHAITSVYNANGQVTDEMFADGSSASFTYDAFGDLLTATQTAADGTVSTTTYSYATASRELVKVSYPNDLSLEFSYDTGGRRTQSVDQVGFTVNYQYDTVGHLARLFDAAGHTIVSYTYDPAGRLIEKDLGNSTYTTYQYDFAGNLVQLTNYGPRPRAGQDGPVNSSFGYGYDGLGRMTSLTTAAGEWTYSYDLAGQLVHAVFAPASPSTPGQDLEYVYDPAGNRTSTVINGVTTNYTSNSRNEYVTVGSITYTYDDNGNLTSATGPDGTTVYGYNAANQLVGVTAPDDTTWAYGYDAFGHPISVTINDQTTNYLYDPVGLGYVVGAYTPSGSLVADYTYGLGLTSQVTGSGASYYDFDAGGSTVGLTGANGSYVNQYSYDPYGQLIAAAAPLANPFTFQGQSGVLSAGAGLLSMGARGYAPNLGRFLSANPLGITAGNPNFLTYAANDPLNLTQPTGLTAMTVTLWDTGAAHAAIEVSGQYFAQYAVPESRQGDLFDAPLQAGYWSRGQEHAPPRQTASLEVPADMGQAMAARALDQQVATTYQLWNSEADALRDGAVNVPGNVFAPGMQNVFLHSITAIYYGVDTLVGLGTLVTVASESSIGVASQGWADSIGPTGYGSQNFVAAGSLLAYRIDFGNEPDSPEPAQEVIVTDQLDPSLDWDTFQFGEVGFGNTLLAIPAGTQDYQATVPMTWDGATFDVAIQLSFDPVTGQIVAVFDSIDPETDLPPDPSIGFLPPEDGSGRGIGHFSFLVLPRADLATGTQIRNVALVSVGDGPTVRTDQVNDDDPSQGIDPNKEDLVTIDNGPPAAGVLPLPPVEFASTFPLAWWGQDVAGGSGIAYYDVYYSDNGGAFQPLLRHITLTTTTFHGTPGHSYGFSVIATDNVGNVQPTPAAAQAVTTVRPTTSTTLTSSAVNNVSTFGQAVTLTATVSVSDPAAVLSALAGETITFYDGTAFLGTGLLNARGIATLTLTAPAAGLHVLTATYGGDAADQGSTGVLRGGLAVNRALAGFTRLTASQKIVSGTPSVTLSGYLTAPTAIPVGQTIVIAAGGFSTTAVVRADGSFSAVLNTGGLAASTGVYTIVYAFAGNANFNPVSNTSTALTVISHPVDVLARVSVRLGALQHVAGSSARSQYNYYQTVTVTNTSGATIAGPISLVLFALVNGRLVNATGTTRAIYVRSAYLLLSNVSLAPGASLTTTMYFYDPTNIVPRYTARVVAGGMP